MRDDEPLRVELEELGPRIERLRQRYCEVRGWTERLCEPLEPEDCTVQSMPDVSPTRWHLAHTTWFFETFVLAAGCDDYRPVRPQYEHLFNSYYNQVGRPFPRARRGVLSRPTVREVLEYRQTIDGRILEWLKDEQLGQRPELLDVLELGLHHEQQHQELIVTDIKHVFSCNPLLPVYRDSPLPESSVGRDFDEIPEMSWWPYTAGTYRFGDRGEGFAFDNERPRHATHLVSFELADRPVTNGEYLMFIEDGGYRRPELWLSLGWDQVQQSGWEAPLYWMTRDEQWQQFTLRGLVPLVADQPVCHVSFFEADAYARWAGARLPTEYEWELAAEDLPVAGNLLEQQQFQPRAATEANLAGPSQMFGDVWEWTASPYVGYPGYRVPSGAIGEYNGKFMCNQYVLRGGSCATPRTHLRPTYRNFFPPEARWQFTGIRLAR